MAGIPNPAQVEVIEDCRPDQIPADVLTSDKPLLMKGLISDWPAVRACSVSVLSAAQYLGNFWSDRPVTVYVGDAGIEGRFFYNEAFTGFNFRSGKAQLSQVLQKLAEAELGSGPAESIYVGSTPVDSRLPGFRNANDIKLPGADVLVSFWLGNRTRISAHFDFPDNVACVVAGNRKFTLFPPDQIDNLYVGPLDRTPSGQSISLVDFAQPDFERFPKFAKALDAAVSYEMTPGDAIFIPSMWWHHVESLSSFNLLVNYWWCNSPAAMGSPTSALMHAILALRDLPERQKKAWKNLFDHYVFDASESVYTHIPESGRGCLAPLDDAAARQLRADVLNKLNR